MLCLCQVPHPWCTVFVSLIEQFIKVASPLFKRFHSFFPKQTELQNTALINHWKRGINEFRKPLKLCQKPSNLICAAWNPIIHWFVDQTVQRSLSPLRPIQTAFQSYSQTPAWEGEWWVGHIRASHLNVQQWAGYCPLKIPNSVHL